MATSRIPVATYRLEFNRDFRFVDALALVSYIHDLGITDLYASPILKASRGSLSGYDVTDHTTLNPEIGSYAEFEELTRALREHGMGLLIDVVPNHMGIDDEANRWWWDVLENGPSSPYAKFFDIDWAPPEEGLANKVLLPILGDQYGKVLENGEIHLLFEAGAFVITYYERRFPVAPRSAIAILEPACERVRLQLDAEDPHLVELESIITSLRVLPPHTETDPERVRVRLREKEVAKRRLGDLTGAVTRRASISSRLCWRIRRIASATGTSRAVNSPKRCQERALTHTPSTPTSWRPSVWKSPKSFGPSIVSFSTSSVQAA